MCLLGTCVNLYDHCTLLQFAFFYTKMEPPRGANNEPRSTVASNSFQGGPSPFRLYFRSPSAILRRSRKRWRKRDHGRKVDAALRASWALYHQPNVDMPSGFGCPSGMQQRRRRLNASSAPKINQRDLLERRRRRNIPCLCDWQLLIPAQ